MNYTKKYLIYWSAIGTGIRWPASWEFPPIEFYFLFILWFILTALIAGCLYRYAHSL